MGGCDTPFPAIVGQETLKRALLAVTANDALDGLLVRGERGTAKSTAVRALADLLPSQRAVADCPFGCPPADRARQCRDCQDRTDPVVEERPVPVVTLPLGATRDRIVGTLSVEDALAGDAEFDPGLLARANRGVLYVDEVNLLDDHLVDVLLDAAASGVNRVERDGVSREHPAAFTLVGTMNPEEGDLRPQLRDRFALQATVAGCDDVEDRVTVVERAMARRDDPDAFAAGFEAETTAVRDRLQRARDLVDDVTLPDAFTAEIAEICRNAGVDGHRADIATARTAVSLAALDGRRKVLETDVREAAALALPHRLQGRPYEESPDVDDVLDDHFDDREPDGEGDGTATGDGADAGDGDGADAGDGDGSDADDGGADAGDGECEQPDASTNGEGREHDRTGSPDSGGAHDDSGRGPAGADDGDGGVDDERSNGAAAGDTAADDGEHGDGDEHGEGDDDGADGEGSGSGDGDDAESATPLVPGQARGEVAETGSPALGDVEAERGVLDGGSRADVDASSSGRGSRVRTERAEDGDAVDAAASVRAAAADGRTHVEDDDLRTAVRTGTAGTLVVFVVDASASMRPAMATAKGTVLSVLRDAYEQRDEVAFVAVAGETADVLLPPTNSVSLAARHLKDLPTGDRTPLPDGLDAAHRLVTQADADASLVVVVTDGRANVADGSPTRATRTAARRLASTDASVVLVDAGSDGTGVADVLERETNARRVPLSSLSAETVTAAARTKPGNE